MSTYEINFAKNVHYDLLRIEYCLINLYLCFLLIDGNTVILGKCGVVWNVAREKKAHKIFAKP